MLALHLAAPPEAKSVSIRAVTNVFASEAGITDAGRSGQEASARVAAGGRGEPEDKMCVQTFAVL